MLETFCIEPNQAECNRDRRAMRGEPPPDARRPVRDGGRKPPGVDGHTPREICVQSHDHTLAGHPGVERTVHAVKQLF